VTAALEKMFDVRGKSVIVIGGAGGIDRPTGVTARFVGPVRIETT